MIVVIASLGHFAGARMNDDMDLVLGGKNYYQISFSIICLCI